MEIDANVYHLLNVLMTVLLWSLIVSLPLIILTLEMYGYERYKKWKDTEKKEKEKIIVGKANQITKADEELKRQYEEKQKLSLDLELLQKRKESLQEELGIEEEEKKETPPEETDYESMGIRDLKKIAKEKGLKMYSKKNKANLIKMLRAS